MRLVSVQDLTAKLRCCSDKDFINVPLIRQLVADTPVDPASIEKYLIWDRQHYTRNLIEKNSLFELMAICWDIGHVSSIHNHKGQNCWMAVPIGKLLVQNYRVIQEDLNAGTCDLEPTDLVEMNPGNPCAVDPTHPVHKVYNPSEFQQRAVSLHVYSRPYDSCVVYSDDQHKCGEIKLHYTSEYGLVHK